MKFFLSLLFCVILGTSCTKKNQIQKPLSNDFESLTGRDLSTWHYVQTKEDFEHLAFFKEIYEIKKERLALSSQELKIPKIAHFIWIGPRPFPRESVENVRTWMAKNSDWTFYFWTDRERPVPVPGMEMKKIGALTHLGECYAKADNYGEKSDLLRCEILYKEGGVYVDHDVKCFKSFDVLNSAYDFYCGIDMPYTSSLPSCIYTTNNLIGARAEHPILQRYMELLAANWEPIQQHYPGADRDAMLNRVLHRSFWLFGEAFKQMHNQGENQDIVFPAYYFDAPKEELAIFARHQYAGSWHETESAFEKMVRQRLMILSKKSNQTLLFFSLISGLNVVGFAALFIYIRKRTHAQR